MSNIDLRKELKCKVYPINTLKDYKFVVVCSNYQGKWILSKHKQRDTYETQGGHIEENETPLDTAKRELYEESGIVDAEIYPVCDYDGYTSISSSNGVVFLAKVNSLGTLPKSEMAEIKIFETLPENLTYPNVMPILIEESNKFLKKLNQLENNL